MRHELMSQINEHLVLDDVHTQGVTTRPEIAARLGLSAATVSRAVRHLVDQDLVREEPGPSTEGRPRAVITFNARSGCVIGIGLGATRCRAMLADLTGSPLFEEVRPSDADGSPFETLVASIDRLMLRKERAGASLAALAVGVPAIVDPVTGVAIGGPNVHWDGFPLAATLREHLDAPFVIENDVNLAALGHAWKGDAKGHSDFAVLSLGTGVGAAIVADGHLLRGRHGAAGEIGYLALDRVLLVAPRQGDLGAFEALSSGAAVAALARDLLDDTDRASRLRLAREVLDARAVIEAAVAGDGLAAEIVDRMIEHVAMAVIAIATVADPEILILDGSVGRALGRWVPRLEALTRRHLPAPPAIVVSSLGGDATAIGVVASALDLSRAQRGPQRSPAARGPLLPEPRQAAQAHGSAS
jgi:glucokinase